MNTMHEKQLNHRTIRFFKDQPVPATLNEQLMEVMNRTATSMGMQFASVVRISDPDKKQALADICKQAYVADAPELLVFIVDVRRNAKIAEAKGYEGENARSMDFFLQGFTDAALMAQNLTNAVEAADLGAVYLGSILNDQRAVIELLGLPELTMPVVGLAYGYPDDHPELKPRMAVNLKLYENAYDAPEDYLTTLADYDETMTHYYDTRKKNQRSDSFTNQVLNNISNNRELRSQYFRVVQEQGFDLRLQD